MDDHAPVSPPHVVRRLLVALALLAVLGLGATTSAAGAHTGPVAITASAPAGTAPVGPAGGASTSDDADHDDFGWGPSRVVWAGFGWLAVVLAAAILLRRRASRRRPRS